METEGVITQYAMSVARQHVRRGAGSSPPARRKRITLALTLASILLGTLATPALAARGHEYAGSFGWGVQNGKTELQRCKSEAPPAAPVCEPGLAGSEPGQFNNPTDIALNETTGELYVIDESNDRVEIFNASGTKVEGEFDGSGTHPNEGKAAGSGGEPEEVPTGKFDEPGGIAVDNDPTSPSFGDVYVLDPNGHKSGTFEEERKVIDKFDKDGGYIGQITHNPNGEPFAEEGFQKLVGVSVDVHGEVWVEGGNFGGFNRGAANYTNAEVNKWIGFRSTEDQLSSVSGPGLAVDSKSGLYVHNTFGGSGNIDRIAKFTDSGELLTPEFDEEVPTGVTVEAVSDDVYVGHITNVHRLDSAGVSLEVLEASGSHFAGVAVNHATLTVYAADPEANRVEIFSPEPPGVPTIQPGSEGVSDVSATSANFTAEINPRSEENEAATSYAFQYGPCSSPTTCSSASYTQSIPTPEGSLAPNYEPDMVGAHPQDLQAGTSYHMRVVAHNSHGEAKVGEEVNFRTQRPSTEALPDQRQWELVSPPDKSGAILLPIEGSGLIQAAASGDAISYLGNAPTEAKPAGFSQTVQILSRRGSSSWDSQDIPTPHEATVGVSIAAGQGEYHFFSEDLSSAVVQPFGPFTLSITPQSSEKTPLLRSNFPSGDPNSPCATACYRPLVSGCPEEGEPCPGPIQEVANVPDGTKFGHELDPYFLGANPDGSHIVLTAKAALTEGAPEGEGGSLYEWAGGKLELVSILPNGQPLAVGTRPTLGYTTENTVNIRMAREAISTNGERIVFSEREGSHHLYLRDVANEQTVQLDTPEVACTAKGKCKGTAKPIFQTASADGSRVFFTDGQPLTQDAGNSDLYECQIEEAEEELSCKLSDLTPPKAGEEGGGVLGLVAGASEDGATIYFTANGKLSEGPSAHGEQAVAGNCKGDTDRAKPESETAPERCNMYVRSAGQTKLVAVLSGADFPDWALRASFGLHSLTQRVSPDGGKLAFMSRRSLSGYDNSDAASNKPDEEVFLYDASANTVSCASCDPSGGRPRGVQFKAIDTDEGGLTGGQGVWPASSWIAANVPGWTAVSEGEGFALHQSRYLSNSGRLFFNSADALVPQDGNKTEDVYEYEPSGIGDCEATMPTYSPASGGCVALISSGTAKEESAFLDASESGDDVFFLTGQRLLPTQDVDNSLDVYDAHACSATSPCLPAPQAPLPACEGDSCQSPGAPPGHQTPGSLTYQGPGNPPVPAAPKPKLKTAAQLKAEKLKKALAICRKKKSKPKRSACEAKARKLYGPHKAKKTKKPAKKKGKKRQ